VRALWRFPLKVTRAVSLKNWLFIVQKLEERMSVLRKGLERFNALVGKVLLSGAKRVSAITA